VWKVDILAWGNLKFAHINVDGGSLAVEHVLPSLRPVACLLPKTISRHTSVYVHSKACHCPGGGVFIRNMNDVCGLL
jgi:hypothetical protein